MIIVCSVDGSGLPKFIVNHVVLVDVHGIDVAVPAIERGVATSVLASVLADAVFMNCHELTVPGARR